MKKNLIAVSALSAALCLAACTPPGEKIDPNALTIMGKRSDLERTYMTRIFDLYEKETQKTLNIVKYEDVEYETAASERFAKGDVPDIFMHFNNADLHRFNVEENFYYLNAESWVSDLTDSAKAYCQDGDQNLLGLPFWESSVSGCYYNQTLLEELGLGPASTQAEFDGLCQALKQIGRTPICWPADGCTWMLQFGLDPIFADNPTLLNKLNRFETAYSDIPEVRNMIEWLQSAAEKGWFGSNSFKTGWDEIGPIMGEGQAAMVFIWDTWFTTDFNKDGANYLYSADDFALMPVFMNTEDSGTYEGGNLNMMMVNKNSGKLEQALDFLSFCATPEHYNIAFEGISTVSCFKRQTTNIQSQMVINAADSIARHERVSTAATKIVGYNAEDMMTALNQLLQNRTDVSECLRQMDEFRYAEAHKQGLI